MANNYYTFTPEFVPGQKVRSDDVNTQLSSIEVGFDQLPGDTSAITRGVSTLGTESGTGNTYTITMDDTRTSYQEGDRVSFRATHTNTGAATINVDTLGSKALRRSDNEPLVAGDIESGLFYEAVYAATANVFQLQTPAAGFLADADLRVGWSEEWANSAINTLVSTDAGGNGVDEYSARHWADGAAQAWAINAEDSAIGTTFGGDGATTYSALHWAAKSSASASASAASAAAALVSEGLSDDNVGYSQEWAINAVDALVSVAAGGNGTTDYSSLHWGAGAKAWAEQAEDSPISTTFGGDGASTYSAKHWAAKASGFAAGVNLPAIQAGDADKILEVNAGETGYELTARAASETATGFVELATNAEVTAGTDTERAITPAGLQQKTATETALGIIELATNAEVTTGSDTTRAVTPAGLHQKTASETAIGLIELATNAEVTTGTDTARAVTPAGLQQKTASETALGIVELATDAETLTGTDSSRVLTPSTLAYYLQNSDRKNRIINGTFETWQRGNSFTSVTSEFTADRWKWVMATDAVIDVTKATLVSSTIPFTTYINMEVQTADASLSAGQYAGFVYFMEGHDMSDWQVGTSAAATVTLSFWTSHDVAGTYSGSLRNGTNTRSYPFEYTQTSVGVWQKNVVTVTLDTTGAWNWANSTGLKIHFACGLGTSFHGTADTWASANYLGTSGQTNILATATNNFRLGNVQLEQGEYATLFDKRPRAEDVTMCKRYYQILSDSLVVGNGNLQTSTTANILVPMPVMMRATPSITTTVANHRVRSAGTNFTPSAVSVQDRTENGVVLDYTISGGTQYQTCSSRANNEPLEFEAELS